LTIEFDARQITVAVNGVTQLRQTAHYPAPAGLCYLHLQTLAQASDSDGTYIKELHFESSPKQ